MKKITAQDLAQNSEISNLESSYKAWATVNPGSNTWEEMLEETAKSVNDNNGNENDAEFIIEDMIRNLGIAE